MSRSNEESQQAIITYAVHKAGDFAVDATRTYDEARRFVGQRIGYAMSNGCNYDEIANRAKHLSDYELIGMHSLLEEKKPRIISNEMNAGWALVLTFAVVPLGYFSSGVKLGLAAGATMFGAGALRMAYGVAINKGVIRGMNSAFERAEDRSAQEQRAIPLQNNRQLDMS